MEESRERTDEGGGGSDGGVEEDGMDGRRGEERRGEGVAHSSERPPSNSAAVAAAARAGEQLHQPDRHAVKEGGGCVLLALKCPCRIPRQKGKIRGCGLDSFVTSDNCHS